MSDQKSSAPFPGDLSALLLLPAILIVYAVVDFRYSWLVILLIGVSQLWIGTAGLRARRSSPLAWLALLFGIVVVCAAIYLALMPGRLKTI